MNPRVVAVTPTDNYKLQITFTNGEVGIYDCSPLLGFGVFKAFQEIDYFKQASVEGGTVVWPNEQDICPDTSTAMLSTSRSRTFVRILSSRTSPNRSARFSDSNRPNSTHRGGPRIRNVGTSGG